MFPFDTASLALITVGIALVASPFIYYSYKLKKQTSMHFATFEEFSVKHNVSPAQHEYWRNHYHLGLDSQYQKLIYHRFGPYPEQSLIDLKEVSKISLQEKTRKVEIGKERRYILEYLALQFHFKDASHPPKTIEMYDGSLFTSQAGERALAEKWLGILGKQVSNGA